MWYLCFVPLILLVSAESEIPQLYKNVLEVEQRLIKGMEDYVEVEKKRLENLKTLAADNQELEKEFIFNPVNVFKLIKKMVNSDVFQGMRENKAQDVLEDILKEMPTEKLLGKAASEVFKFQDEQGILTKDMANGDLPDKMASKPLNVDDCFHMGRMAYLQGDYYHTVLWMEEAVERLKLKKDAEPLEWVPFWDYLAFSYYKMGNPAHAWWTTKKILEIDPENKRSSGNMGWYESGMVEKGIKFPKAEGDLPKLILVKKEDMPQQTSPVVNEEKKKKKKKKKTVSEDGAKPDGEKKKKKKKKAKAEGEL